MTRFLTPLLFMVLPSIGAMAQLPGMDDRDANGLKVAYRPFLGRIAVYNELFGLGIGHTFNIEASPLMTDAITLNLRVGSGRPIVMDYENKDGFNMVYGVGAEFGRRRSRIALSAGLWNVIVPSYIRPYRGDTTDTRLDFNWFGTVGYRYQAPKGFFFGFNVYLLAANTGYLPTVTDISPKRDVSLWPGTYLGYRIPSTPQHRALRAYSRLSKSERAAIRQESRTELLNRKLSERLSDSTRVTAASRSEFGLTFFGPALLTINYTVYVPLKEDGIANYYLRSGLGTAMPLFQWSMETGVAFMKSNSGAMVGGGGAMSFGENSLDAFVVLRGKVGIGKGFSANAGLMVLWSTGTPYTFIPKKGRPYLLPSVGFAYRLPKSRR